MLQDPAGGGACRPADCVYLADGSPLIPKDRFDRADMLCWMFFEQYSHEPNVATLRFWLRYIGEARLSEAQRDALPARRAAGAAALGLMDVHLASRDFFVAGRFTLADIALYAYTHVAGEGGFDLARWPAAQAWCARVAALPGHVRLSD